MKISSWKVVWNFLTGGGTKVVDYLLGLLNNAISQIGNPTREKIQGVLNFAKKILSTLKVFQVFVPVKWQTAFDETVKAVEVLIDALSDLKVTGEELDAVVEAYKKAYAAWQGPDDESCVDCEVK